MDLKRPLYTGLLTALLWPLFLFITGRLALLGLLTSDIIGLILGLLIVASATAASAALVVYLNVPWILSRIATGVVSGVTFAVVFLLPATGLKGLTVGLLYAAGFPVALCAWIAAMLVYMLVAPPRST